VAWRVSASLHPISWPTFAGTNRERKPSCGFFAARPNTKKGSLRERVGCIRCTSSARSRRANATAPLERYPRGLRAGSRLGKLRHRPGHWPHPGTGSDRQLSAVCHQLPSGQGRCMARSGLQEPRRVTARVPVRGRPPAESNRVSRQGSEPHRGVSQKPEAGPSETWVGVRWRLSRIGIPFRDCRSEGSSGCLEAPSGLRSQSTPPLAYCNGSRSNYVREQSGPA